MHVGFYISLHVDVVIFSSYPKRTVVIHGTEYYTEVHLHGFLHKRYLS